MKIIQRQTGFTLLELLTVIAVVGIFAAIGMPSMSDMVRNNRVTSARMGFINDLNLARSEAVKRNTRVLVCSGQTGCTNQADWARTGWIICFDGNKDGACDAATADNPNPFVVRAPQQQDIGLTGPAAPLVYNSIGSQGIPPAAIVSFSLKGTWSGAPATPLINVAPTGFTSTH